VPCTLPEVDIDLVLRTARFLQTAQGSESPSAGVDVEAVIPVDWGVDGGLVAVHSDGTVATRLLGEHPPPHVLHSSTQMLLDRSFNSVQVPSMEPTAQTIVRGFMEMGRPVPDIVHALNARQAARTGDTVQLDVFTSDVLGLWCGWREAVSTALIGDWANPLHADGSLGSAALKRLRDDTRISHRQATPMWRRKINRSRLLLLDTPLGDGLTLYDLVADRPDSQQLPTLEVELEDPRLAALMRALDAAERAVAWAWVDPSVSTWREAASHADADNPTAVGERVRRKVRRLVAERHLTCLTSQAATARSAETEVKACCSSKGCRVCRQW
jgi:hypothetical protein